MNGLVATVQRVRSGTRVALPADDSYLFRLRVALYGFAYVNAFMCEVITHLDLAKERHSLEECPSGKVLDTFRATVKCWNGNDISAPAKRAADEFERLNTERNNFVHAYPITNAAAEQILHRRVDRQDKYFEVTNDFLDGFSSRLTLVTDALYEIRGIVRPDLGQFTQ